jgi:hypothetical protein
MAFMQIKMKLFFYLLIFVIIAEMRTNTCCYAEQPKAKENNLGHPRLYFNAGELAMLRELRTKGVHQKIWRNMEDSAKECLTRPLRTQWIAPITPDPNYLNLYDRFYAMMADMAVMEHLAFAYAYSDDPAYFGKARLWLLSNARIWQNEAEGEPDQNKAYAVTRILKGLAICYDILYPQLDGKDRQEVRDTIVRIGDKYYEWYLHNPDMAGVKQNKHHGSVEAASFGIAGLALLGDYDNAQKWVELMIQKHKEFLLPKALTSDGDHEQTSNYWVSTMQYRIMFMDALRRVMGVDLFRAYEKYMDARIALATIVGERKAGFCGSNESVLFNPSYGQLDYWSPVLVFLAREYRHSTYQYLALRDQNLGLLQKTRYITPNDEQLFLCMGGYAYCWYDDSVPAQLEPNLPTSFIFPQTNEAYLRNSYNSGDIAAGIRRGHIIFHDGREPIVSEIWTDRQTVAQPGNITLTDDGNTATIVCGKDICEDFSEQRLAFKRPDKLLLERKTDKPLEFWSYELPVRDGNDLIWHNRYRLTVTNGTVSNCIPEGYEDAIVTGLGKLRCMDPAPKRYAKIVLQPINGIIRFEVNRLSGL